MGDDSKKVWRYMNLPGFASVLDQKGLRFSSAEAFRKNGDPFEGAIPEAWIKWEEEETQSLKEENAPAILGATNATREALRKEGPWIFVNCWHISDYESLAMWNLYAKDDASVCVQSTYGRLRRNLPKSIHVGKVEYFDHKSGQFAPGSVFTPYMYKRHAFSHERELRAVWFDQTLASHSQDPPPRDHWEPVNLDDLIEKVIVRPATEKWVRDSVRQIVKVIAEKHLPSVPVEPSEIDLDPLYA